MDILKVKVIIFAVMCIVITGCQSPKRAKVTGEYVWKNNDLYSMKANGEITEAELDHKFIIAKSLCKIESLKVPIPSPSCSARPVTSCAGLTGLALGMCQGSQASSNNQICDYSSVYAAQDAQIEIFASCMIISGWERIWESF